MRATPPKALSLLLLLTAEGAEQQLPCGHDLLVPESVVVRSSLPDGATVIARSSGGFFELEGGESEPARAPIQIGSHGLSELGEVCVVMTPDAALVTWLDARRPLAVIDLDDAWSVRPIGSFGDDYSVVGFGELVPRLNPAPIHGSGPFWDGDRERVLFLASEESPGESAQGMSGDARQDVFLFASRLNSETLSRVVRIPVEPSILDWDIDDQGRYLAVLTSGVENSSYYFVMPDRGGRLSLDSKAGAGRAIRLDLSSQGVSALEFGDSTKIVDIGDGEVIASLVSARNAKWSPDGMDLAFQKDGGLYVWSLDDRVTHFVASHGLLRESERTYDVPPTWSLDGRYLASTLAGHQGSPRHDVPPRVPVVVVDRQDGETSFFQLNFEPSELIVLDSDVRR